MMKIFSLTERLLKSIDMYGQKIELNFQKQNLYKTVFGGFLTLFILVLFSIGCWFYGSELIYKQKPSVISSTKPVISPKRIDIKSDNLIIMISIANYATQSFVDPSIFAVRAVQESIVFYNDTITGKEIKKLVQSPIAVKPCTKDDIGISSLNDYFMHLDLPKFYCFENNQQIFMEGDYDADKFSQVFIYVEKCKNSTSSEITCKTPEEIDEKLRLTKVQIFMSDKTIDPLDFQNPLSDRGIGLFSLTSSFFPKELQFYFTNQYIESDIGILYEDIQKSSSFIFVEQKDTPFYSDSNVLVRMLFRLQKQKENLMQRRYLKLADVVAQIGGLLKILTSIGTLISFPISKLYLFKAIVDEVFQFDSINGVKLESKNTTSIQEIQTSPKSKQPEKKEKKPNQNPSKNVLAKKKKSCLQPEVASSVNSPCLLNIQTVNQSQQNMQEIKSNQNSSSLQKKIEELMVQVKDYFQYSHKVIKYQFFNFFSHTFLPKFKQIKKQYRLVEEGVDKIQDHLDVLFILNKLLEIDKIKSILLNPNQLKLFEFIPKPVISDESSDDVPSLNVLQDDSNKSNTTKSNNNTTTIDQTNNKNQPQNSQSNNQNISSKSMSKDDLKKINDNKSPKFNSEKVYSIYKQDKTETEKAQDAYDGLSNIFKQRKISKVDEKLINLINPTILLQYQSLTNNLEIQQKEETLSFCSCNSNFDAKKSIQSPNRKIDQQVNNYKMSMFTQSNPKETLKELLSLRNKSKTVNNNQFKLGISPIYPIQEISQSISPQEYQQMFFNNEFTLNQEYASENNKGDSDKSGSIYDIDSIYFVEQDVNQGNNIEQLEVIERKYDNKRNLNSLNN